MDYLVQAVKLVVAVSFVMVLSVIAERLGPKWAGVISGFPTGTSITLFFFGYEQGADFASRCAIYNMVGLVAFQLFMFFYYAVSDNIKKRVILVSSFIAFAGYFSLLLIFHSIDLPFFIAAILPIASIPLFIFLFRRIQDVKVSRVKLGPKVLLARALIAGAIITGITMAAYVIGPTWSGLLSAFPTTVFPLILILHFTYGKEPVHVVLKNVPPGLVSVVLFALTVYFAYPRVGIWWGTLIAFGAAAAYMAGLLLVKRALGKSRKG
jgi:hypothetical protein